MKLRALIVLAAGLAIAAGDAAKTDRDRIQGSWLTVSMELNGQTAPAAEVRDIKTVFDGERYVQSKGDKVLEEGTITLAPNRTPKTINFKILTGHDKGKEQLGIYEIEGDTLKICVSQPDTRERPTEFKTNEDSQTAFVVMKRHAP